MTGPRRQQHSQRHRHFTLGPAQRTLWINEGVCLSTVDPKANQALSCVCIVTYQAISLFQNPANERSAGAGTIRSGRSTVLSTLSSCVEQPATAARPIVGARVCSTTKQGAEHALVGMSMPCLYQMTG